MKYIKRIVSLFLVFVMLCSLFTPASEVQAATKKKVALNKTKLTLYVGEAYQLKLSNTKAAKVKWSTSNKKIVTVDKKGKVTAKKKGSAKVTAKVGKKSYTCKVTIKVKPKLNKTKLTLITGEKYQLKLSNVKASSVKWLTSNKKIVTVDKKGKVTAKKKGSATITVKAEGKSYKCKITVKNAPAISKTKIEIYDGYSYQLKLNNVSATDVTWSTSNKNIATVDKDGKVTGVKAGTATITAKAGKKSYKCKVTVKSVALKTTEIVIYIGKAQKLELNKGNIKNASTSDETVVTVTTDGTVTAVGYGEAVITITSDLNKTYTCKVKVYVEGTPATTMSTFLAKKECNSEKESYVYIYATFNGVVGDVGLYDAKGNFLMYFFDDGKYGSSGDDLQGDGVYSTKYYTTWLVEGVNTLYAKANVNGKVLTSKIELNNVISFTSGELSSLMSAKEKLTNDLFFYGFSDLPFDRRKEIADTILADLETEGLIKKDSVYYDDTSKCYTFLYSAGVAGMVLIDDIDESGYETNSGASANNVLHIGNACILDAFLDDAPDNYLWFRNNFYRELEENWDQKGLDTNGAIASNVEAFKNIGYYDLILISGHGAYGTYKAGTLNAKNTGVSALILTDEVTRIKSGSYSSDLKNHRVSIVSNSSGSFYAITPKFFEFYYGTDGLEGKFVFAENCSVYGHNRVVDTAMADAIIGAGAESFVGFHNDVMARYSREFMQVYVDHLILGKTAGEAFNAAISTKGANDYFEGREAIGQTAYPIFSGDKTATLYKAQAFTNGDFETEKAFEGWKCSGDARVLESLGKFTPVSKNKMAVLTTGIGSQAYTKKYGSTDNGTISQLITIPAGTKKLCFTYNMISEEPMDFIGTQYNDMFCVNLANASTSQQLMCADLVNSTWYEVTGIDFAGGDDSVYQTKWITVELDVSAFAGSTAELTFFVDDVIKVLYDAKTESGFSAEQLGERTATYGADSATDYVTVVLLDNIYFK